MGFVVDTQIKTPGGAVAIQSLSVGADVMATGSTGGAPNWTSERLKSFRQSPAGTPRRATWIEFGSDKDLCVTPDQIFLLAGDDLWEGRLRRADKLSPGDTLLGDDGRPLIVSNVMAGESTASICDLATDVSNLAVDYIDNHLISANGVIVGDYLVQERSGLVER